jgi:hypothetical protein
MSDPKRDDELLSAYVDGIGELTPDERRLVDLALADPAVRADEGATRELLGELRELPPAGGPPDWTALERSIAEATGPAVPRPPWWSRWRFALPAFALAASAAIVFLVVRPDREDVPVAPVADNPSAPPSVEPAPVFAIYLDGTGMEIELTAEDLLDDPFDDLVADDGMLEVVAPDMIAPDDLAWVDDLDAEDLERVESYLERGRG